jgi:hypothetical protein
MQSITRTTSPLSSQPPNPSLRLVIDEDLSWRIAPELRARGRRDTTSAAEWGIAGRGVKDPLWLYIIERSGTASVLVTFDNKMANVHRSAILKRNSTLAVIDSDKKRRAGLTREEYTRDVIHRWAHRMATQPAGSRRKYTRTRSTAIKV